MKRQILMGLVLTMMASVVASGELALIPRPASVKLGDGVFVIERKTAIRVAMERDAPLGKMLADELAVATGWRLNVEVGPAMDAAICLAWCDAGYFPPLLHPRFGQAFHRPDGHAQTERAALAFD